MNSTTNSTTGRIKWHEVETMREMVKRSKRTWKRTPGNRPEEVSKAYGIYKTNRAALVKMTRQYEKQSQA
jgi:hypothetical protein